MIILRQNNFSKIPKSLLIAGGTVAGGALIGAGRGFYKGKKYLKNNDLYKEAQNTADHYDKLAKERQDAIDERKTKKWKKEDAKWKREHPDEVSGDEYTIKDLEYERDNYKNAAKQERERAKKLSDPKELKKEKRDLLLDNVKSGALGGAILGTVGATGILLHRAKKSKKK